jgi:DNA-binding NarL/FixJ family response regulator
MNELARRDSSPILVVIADSTRMHSQLLADALRRDRRIQVVGAVSTSRELLEIAAKVPIHIAVISCNLDEDPSRGFEVLHEIQLLRPVRGIFLLDSSKPEMVVEAFRAGARGILSKYESLKSLCKCVRRVHEDQIWANSRELTYALDALSSAHHRVRAVDAKGIDLLSKREREVVQAVAEGLTNREIGERLQLSRHTIKNYLLRIFDKVGVSNRMEMLFLTLSAAPAATCSPTAYKPLPMATPVTHGGTTQQDFPAAQFKLPQLARKKIADSMSTADISAAQRRMLDWSQRLEPKKSSPPVALEDAPNPSHGSEKVFSAD